MLHHDAPVATTRTAMPVPDETVRHLPSLAWFGLEPMRAAIEYAGMRCMDRAALPCGDGHPVLVFPGLASGERSIAPLVSCCAGLGYAARGWGRGHNIGPRGHIEAWLGELAGEADALHRQHGRAMSLIGWSLGGIYAREIAKLLGPRRVRQVITIGTPFAGSGADTRVGWLYKLLSGRSAAIPQVLAVRLRAAPPVPCTSIYSRSDGIVAWQACLDADAGRARMSENIEIEGSHSGMGWNPRVLAVVADRLAQPAGAWRPYAAAASRH
jgi:hypothetical protein